MKNRKLFCSFILCIFIAGCGAQPGVQASPPSPVVIVVTATFIPGAANSTVTTIPLPQPQASLIVPATVPVPVINSLSPLASPIDGAVNCRGGPDIRWPVGTRVNPGESVEVTGRNADNTWWYVKVPTAPMGSCWISAEFVTVTGDVSRLKIVVPDVPVPVYAGTPAGTINFVHIELEPDTIDAPGCVGPIPSIRIAAKIGVSGPVDFRFRFEGEEIGRLRIHHWGFEEADIDDVSDTFTPPIHAGTHTIYLVVDGIDLQGLNQFATYTINC